MTLEILPNLLRAIVSTVANVLLMMTLLQPKYSRRVTLIIMLGILSADMGTAIWCYISGNLTMLSKIDTLMFLALCFAVRPAFKDTFMQWLFSYLTVQNISYIVVILSYLISLCLPFPRIYSNTVIRLILFSVFIFILRHYFRPLYRQAVEHWTAYFAVALALYGTFMYYIMSTDDIIVLFTTQAIPLLLVIIIGLAAYGSIFLSLRNLQREFALKEENRQIQASREYLSLSAKSMMNQLSLMEKTARENRISAHDRRHFNNTILELIEQGQISEATGLLCNSIQAPPEKNRHYCENPVVNATVSWYTRQAENADIECDISLDVPTKLDVDSLELSMVVSNLMENAINGCLAQGVSGLKYLHLTCRISGRLLLEIENPCASGVELDSNGQPQTTESGHGTGSRSVAAFIKKYDGELLYRIKDGVFRVRLLV